MDTTASNPFALRYAADMRAAYRAIYLYRNDTPADRRLWSGASGAAQSVAACEVHAERNSPPPDWALRGSK
jgi:hypothetical protein